MKKLLLWIAVLVMTIVIALTSGLVGCVSGAAAATTAAGETTAAAATTAAGETKAAVVAEEKPTYVVVNQNWSHPWNDDWKNGIEAAKKFFNVNIESVGPSDVNPDQMLIDQETAIGKKPAGLMTNAFVPEQIEGLNKAVEQGIPVVFINGAFEEVNYLSFVGTDNFSLGQTLAKEYVKRVGTSGKIGILTQLTAANHVQRVKGVLSILEQYPDIQVVDPVDNFNDMDKSIAAVASLIAKAPDMSAIFGTDGYSAVAIVTALKEAGKAPGEIKGYATDYNEAGGLAIKEGYLELIVTQSPALEPFYGVAVLEQYRLVDFAPLPSYKKEMKTVPFRIMTPTPVIDINNVGDYLPK